MMKIISMLFALFMTNVTLAAISVPMYLTTEKSPGKSLGSVDISETKYGLLFTPKLHSLTPGMHGFHIHDYPDCDNNGMAAGGHLDPDHTNKHLGPYTDQGHLGDLPALYVDSDGNATLPVLAPRLTSLQSIKHHALMVHNGGDNYSDQPEKLGGGGMRMVCGVIK